MYALKIVTTTFNIIMMCIVLFFMRSSSWEIDKSAIIGFSAMQILYLMNLFFMWY